MFAPADLQRNIFAGALLLSLLAAFYWLLIASDRYVSEAHIIIQRTDLVSGQTVDFSGLLGNVGGNTADQLLLRDHLLSLDMLRALDEKLDLRAHYSNWRRDPLSRMWFEDTPIEKFQDYFLGRVNVDFDEYTGVLVIKAQAYDPDTAHAIAALMVEEGERHMNAMAHELANEQVAFLERQVAAMSKRAMKARQAVLAFQNSNSLASPAAAAQTLEGIIARLESQLTDLQTRRGAMLGYLVSDSPSITEIDLEIGATRDQIAREQAKLASPDGNTLNRTIEEFQRIEADAGFADDVYKTSLVALEKGRIEATRTLKKVSVLQKPSQPEYPLQPRRIYNAIVFLLVSLLLAGVLNLVAVIIRDHRD
ncbi:MAG: chain-length determining protein [Gammaproteobacteria bacterium]|nr:chain-length determining protein [Gammaproteobacteria bacterium]MBK6585041.1 chain-length determining protein [Gammaproteobacteria bacterium]MBK7168687.1 chain-length determining protein [Gammaproteobacteria bacterium]MBK7729532.1 chain-length determining protein [Gammaproteobacteria bacterium]MBK8308689.1 chain-length determining protein [Gammaproteobacteria bacterium]